MGRNMAAGLVVAAMVLAAGPSFGQSMETYFPLEEGKRWEYDVALMTGDTVDRQGKVVATNMAITTLKGKKVLPRKYDQEGQVGQMQYTRFFALEPDGIALVAFQISKKPEPDMLEQPYPYLKGPLTKGNTWGQEGGVRGKIVSLTEEVKVPAGTYKNCLKVQVFSPTPQQDRAQESIFWFAPGVGIVKSIHLFKENKKIVYQLMSVK